ncbi:HTH-type transcriptional activator IlvY [Cellvibrio sp.]|uniref:HTH-type transcriptional activator IlvY n=1 Tax=Cellvibrio sp. TaxID=1965322 RepID=UPI0039647E76
MDIAKLKLFCALASSLHFGRAASACHVSPSTLSRNIKQLEDDLGVSLFERDNRSVALTHEGHSYLQFAKEVLQQWEAYQESLLAKADQLHGQLSIYCSVTASYSFLYDILTEFRVKHPGIAIKLHTGDPAQAIERVQSGYEDIVIAAKPEKMPAGISFKPITNSPLVFITAKNVDWENWNQIPLIIPEEGMARERLDNWFREQKITPNIYAEVKGNEAIVSMVSLGFGVGVLPKIVVDNSPLADRVEPFKEQPDLGPYSMGICVMEKRLKSPILNAFWAQLTTEK